jgi:hypothetical protein
VNPIGQWNAVQNLAKLAAIGIAIQSHEIDMLSMSVHCPLYKRYEVAEELRLVDDDNLVGYNVHVIEILRMNARSIPTVMRSDDALAISIV